jgi:hypothetical protein
LQGIQLHGQAQLVFELLGENPGLQAMQDARHKLLPVRATQCAVLQAAAHHGPRPSMPQAPGLRLHKCNAVVYGYGILH